MVEDDTFAHKAGRAATQPQKIDQQIDGLRQDARQFAKRRTLQQLYSSYFAEFDPKHTGTGPHAPKNTKQATELRDRTDRTAALAIKIAHQKAGPEGLPSQSEPFRILKNALRRVELANRFLELLQEEEERRKIDATERAPRDREMYRHLKNSQPSESAITASRGGGGNTSRGQMLQSMVVQDRSGHARRNGTQVLPSVVGIHESISSPTAHTHNKTLLGYTQQQQQQPRPSVIPPTHFYAQPGQPIHPAPLKVPPSRRYAALDVRQGSRHTAGVGDLLDWPPDRQQQQQQQQQQRPFDDPTEAVLDAALKSNFPDDVQKTFGRRRRSKQGQGITDGVAATRPASKRKKLQEASSPDEVNLLESSDDEEPTKPEPKRALRPARAGAYETTAQKFEGLKCLFPPEGGPGSVEITALDLAKLDPDEFLNDSIIDFYLAWVKHNLPEEVQSRCYFFNSFFLKKLQERNPGKKAEDKAKLNFEKVRKWTKGKDIFSADFIFVPVHDALHWSLAILCHVGKDPRGDDDGQKAETTTTAAAEDGEEHTETTPPTGSNPHLRPEPRPLILHLDSMAGGHSVKEVSKVLRDYLTNEWNAKLNDPESDNVAKQWAAAHPGETREFTEATIPAQRATVPQQDNHCDCGLFLCTYVEFFATYAPPALNQAAVKAVSGARGGRRRASANANAAEPKDLWAGSEHCYPGFLTKEWFHSGNAGRLRVFMKHIIVSLMAEQVGLFTYNDDRTKNWTPQNAADKLGLRADQIMANIWAVIGDDRVIIPDDEAMAYKTPKEVLETKLAYAQRQKEIRERARENGNAVEESIPDTDEDRFEDAVDRQKDDDDDDSRECLEATADMNAAAIDAGGDTEGVDGGVLSMLNSKEQEEARQVEFKIEAQRKQQSPEWKDRVKKNKRPDAAAEETERAMKRLSIDNSRVLPKHLETAEGLKECRDAADGDDDELEPMQQREKGKKAKGMDKQHAEKRKPSRPLVQSSDDETENDQPGGNCQHNSLFGAMKTVNSGGGGASPREKKFRKVEFESSPSKQQTAGGGQSDVVDLVSGGDPSPMKQQQHASRKRAKTDAATGAGGRSSHEVEDDDRDNEGSDVNITEMDDIEVDLAGKDDDDQQVHAPKQDDKGPRRKKAAAVENEITPSNVFDVLKKNGTLKSKRADIDKVLRLRASAVRVDGGLEYDVILEFKDGRPSYVVNRTSGANARIEANDIVVALQQNLPNTVHVELPPNDNGAVNHDNHPATQDLPSSCSSPIVDDEDHEFVSPPQSNPADHDDGVAETQEESLDFGAPIPARTHHTIDQEVSKPGTSKQTKQQSRKREQDIVAPPPLGQPALTEQDDTRPQQRQTRSAIDNNPSTKASPVKAAGLAAPKSTKAKGDDIVQQRQQKQQQPHPSPKSARRDPRLQNSKKTKQQQQRGGAPPEPSTSSLAPTMSQEEQEDTDDDVVDLVDDEEEEQQTDHEMEERGGRGRGRGGGRRGGRGGGRGGGRTASGGGDKTKASGKSGRGRGNGSKAKLGAGSKKTAHGAKFNMLSAKLQTAAKQKLNEMKPVKQKKAAKAAYVQQSLAAALATNDPIKDFK